MTRDLRGFKNGTITGVAPSKARSGGSIIWLCQCDCGEELRLPARELVHAKSLAHPGCSIRLTKHPLHSTWRGIIKRCADKSDMNYGGRGIQMSPEWRYSFERFLADLGPKPSPAHSVDRIDVNGDYCKENCRWATPQEQALNTRTKKLSPADCYSIFTSKSPAKVEASKYNVSPQTVRNIRCHQYSRQVKAYILLRLAQERSPHSPPNTPLI